MSNTLLSQPQIAHLTNLRLFLWNETPSPISVAYYEGLFLFNINYKDMGSPLSLHFVTKFKLKSLFYGTIFDLVSQVISSNNILPLEDERFLVHQVTNYILSCFRFRPPLTTDFDIPRLVFVLDISHSNRETLVPCLIRRVKSLVAFPYDVQSTTLTNATGQIVLNSEIMQRTEQSDKEELSTYNEEVTDCLNANEANDKEFNEILTFLRKTFNVKEWKSSSVHKNLCKVRPTLEILHETRDVEDQHDIMCSICLENISREMEVVKMVRCKHVFHRLCVFEWLSNKQSCPYCRTSSVINVYL